MFADIFFADISYCLIVFNLPNHQLMIGHIMLIQL